MRPGKVQKFSEGITIDLLDSREGHDKQYAGHIALKVTETLTTADGVDLVIMPTKPYQVDAVLKRITPFTVRADYLFLT